MRKKSQKWKKAKRNRSISLVQSPIEKRGEFPNKSWQQRYLKLMPDGNLKYFERKEEDIPKGTIEVKKIQSIAKNGKKGKIFQYGFEIVTKKRTYIMAVVSEEWREKWIDEVNSLLSAAQLGISMSPPPMGGPGKLTHSFSDRDSHPPPPSSVAPSSRGLEKEKTYNSKPRYKESLSYSQSIQSFSLKRSKCDVIMQGNVRKKGKGGVMKGSKYLPRYLVLYKNKYLKYYKNKEDGRERGEIELNSGNRITINRKEGNKKFPYRFEVETGERVWYFAVDTLKERDEWVLTLCALLEKEPPKGVNSQRISVAKHQQKLNRLYL